MAVLLYTVYFPEALCDLAPPETLRWINLTHSRSKKNKNKKRINITTNTGARARTHLLYCAACTWNRSDCLTPRNNGTAGRWADQCAATLRPQGRARWWRCHSIPGTATQSAAMMMLPLSWEEFWAGERSPEEAESDAANHRFYSDEIL